MIIMMIDGYIVSKSNGLREARSDLTATAYGMSQQRIYFAGGLKRQTPYAEYSSTLDIYDTRNGQTYFNSIAIPARAYLCSTQYQNFLFFAGGLATLNGGPRSTASSTVDKYNTLTALVSSNQNALYEGRAYMAAGAANGYVLFAGGFNSVLRPSKIVDMYHMESNTWTPLLQGLSEPRGMLSSGSAMNKIVFAGGSKGMLISVCTATVDIFDAVTLRWTNSTNGLSSPRCGCASVSTGKLIFFAGGSTNDTSFSADVDVYDAINNIWAAWSNVLSVARGNLAGGYAGDYIMFGGGFSVSSVGSQKFTSIYAVIDIYNLRTKTWSSKPNGLSVARYNLAAYGVADTIVFAGGMNTQGEKSRVMDIHVAGAKVNVKVSTLPSCSFNSTDIIQYTFSANDEAHIDERCSSCIDKFCVISDLSTTNFFSIYVYTCMSNDAIFANVSNGTDAKTIVVNLRTESGYGTIAINQCQANIQVLANI